MSSGQVCLCVTSEHREKGVVWSTNALRLYAKAVKKKNTATTFTSMSPGKGLVPLGMGAKWPPALIYHFTPKLACKCRFF